MKKDEIILAVDVGGTKTLMSLYHENDCDLSEIKSIKYPVATLIVLKILSMSKEVWSCKL